MQNLCLLIFVFSLIICQDLDMNLKVTEAVLYSNNQVVFKFKTEGGAGEKSFQYIGIPTDWLVNGNDLVISNFTLGLSQQWSFQIKIVDQDENFFRQTIKIVFQGFNVEIHPVTIPEKGNLKLEELSADESQQFNFNQIISRYPGIDENQEEKNYGFNSEKNSDNISQFIANSTTEYNPQKNSTTVSEQEAHRNTLLQKQLSLSKIIGNLFSVINQLTDLISVGEKNIQELSIQTNEKNIDSLICKEEKFSLEDVRAKIRNAINDKKSRVNQYNYQIESNGKILDELELQLNSYKQQRLTIQNKDAPQDKELQSLQAQLSSCEATIAEGKGQIQEIFKQVNENRAEISLLELQIKQSKDRVRGLTSDLSVVRKKIIELKKQLMEAQNEEQKILKEKAYYQLLPLQGEKKIQQLELKVNRLYIQISKLNSSIEKRISNCEDIKKQLKKIREALALSKFNYKTLAKLIEDKEAEVYERKQTINFFKQTSATLPIELVGLEIELQKYEERIKTQGYLCNVAEQQFRKVEENLKTIEKDHQGNLRLLQIAEKNLDEAEKEKKQIDSEYQTLYEIAEMSAESTTNQNQIKRATKLNQNFTLDFISSDPINIGVLQLYLLSSMGFSAEQNLSSFDTILYPIDEKSRRQLVGSLTRPRGFSLFSCQDSPQIKSFKGTFQRISIGTIVVRTNKNYTLSISRCTTISSTSPEIFFQRGVTIYFSGKQLFELGGTTLFDAFELLFVGE